MWTVSLRVPVWKAVEASRSEGDTLIQKEWEGLKPDILMIPIGGRIAKNTTNEDEALEARVARMA